MRQVDYANAPTYALKRWLKDQCGSCDKFEYAYRCPRLRALRQGLLIMAPGPHDDPCDEFELGYDREMIKKVLTLKQLSMRYV